MAFVFIRHRSVFLDVVSHPHPARCCLSRHGGRRGAEKRRSRRGMMRRSRRVWLPRHPRPPAGTLMGMRTTTCAGTAAGAPPLIPCDRCGPARGLPGITDDAFPPALALTTSSADQLAAMSKGAENLKLESEKKSEELGKKVTRQRRKYGVTSVRALPAVAHRPRRDLPAGTRRSSPPASRHVRSMPIPRPTRRVRRANRVWHEYDGERSAQEDL